MVTIYQADCVQNEQGKAIVADFMVLWLRAYGEAETGNTLA